ncbi:MAG: transposase [Patescibacteria group bacterium]|nr:transposase [Patescibacteria group bacterium]
MANRDYKNFAMGECYHVFNRGTGKMDIFKDAADYGFFLKRLKENLYPDTWAPSAGDRYVRKLLPAGAFDLVCYCLMPNHFHLCIRQNTELPISALMVKVCGGYSKYFNRKYSRVGSVLQDQFKSAHADTNEYLLWLSAYIHQNPQVAGLVGDLISYPWSSYPEYVQEQEGMRCKKDLLLEQFKNKNQYCAFVADSFDSIKNKKDLAHLLID